MPPPSRPCYHLPARRLPMRGRTPPPGPQYVWVTCGPRNALAWVAIADAHGRIHRVTTGRLCILGPTPGIRADWVLARNGLHGVRLADGQRAWVRITRQCQWDRAA